MTTSKLSAVNKVLVVDDDPLLVGEYLHCLGEKFEPEDATATLNDLEKVLFRENAAQSAAGGPAFEVHTRNQGEAAVAAVEKAVGQGEPFSIVFLDIRMPPGMDGIAAAQRIREVDANINIVLVTGSMSPEPEGLGAKIPPADKIFFFKKPFHGVECRQLAAALCGKWHSDMALRSANEELERRIDERTAALQKIAYFDPVTRLPNQLLLIEELKAHLARKETMNGVTAVIILDIDRFSFINETMGFDAGTELLRSIGNRLSRAFCDPAAGNQTVVSRFGSDEFALLLRSLDDENAITEVAEKVKRTVEEPFLINGRDLFLKVAIGVAWYPAHGEDAKLVVRCAEAALHRSIRGPDFSITYYHNEMRYRARYKFDLEAELRTAIDNDQICAYYQPQRSTRTGQIAGIEALARWTRPDASVVPPSDFIPLSEEMGISDLLFESIMNSVCDDVLSWKKAMDWQVPVSVNLSAHQLRNKDLVHLIKRILLGKQVDKQLINLELTETVLLEDLTIAQPVLNDLAAFGVGIHIDDFGTGYSSLSYLAQLPVQTVKIDQTFIRKLTDSDDANDRVVEAIIALGKAMHLDVVAEGVETEKQYAAVRKLGCDLAQGYYIARPMPADQVIEWAARYGSHPSSTAPAAVFDLDSKRLR